MSSLMFFVLLQDVQQTFQSSFALVEANFRWGLLLVEYFVKHYVLLSIIQAYIAPTVNRKDQLAFSPTNSRSDTKLDCGNMFTQSQAPLCSPGQRIGELSMMGITWKECLPSPSLGLQAPSAPWYLEMAGRFPGWRANSIGCTLAQAAGGFAAQPPIGAEGQHCLDSPSPLLNATCLWFGLILVSLGRFLVQSWSSGRSLAQESFLLLYSYVHTHPLQTVLSWEQCAVSIWFSI